MENKLQSKALRHLKRHACYLRLCIREAFYANGPLASSSSMSKFAQILL